MGKEERERIRKDAVSMKVSHPHFSIADDVFAMLAALDEVEATSVPTCTPEDRAEWRKYVTPGNPLLGAYCDRLVRSSGEPPLSQEGRNYYVEPGNR